MKVLMVGPLPKDVGGTYTTGICKVAYELSRQKYDKVELYLSSTNIHQRKAVKISTYQNQYNGFRWLIFDIIVDLLFHPLQTARELKYYKERCHVNPWRYEFYKVNIRRHIKRIKPDIIHVHSTGCPAVYFANKPHVPTIDTMHGVFYRGQAGQEKLGDFLRACVEQCDYFTGLTKECETLMKKHFGIPDSKLTIIPNGVNTSLYFFDKDQRSVLRKKQNVGQAVVFITVASVQERKGQMKFIKVLQNLNIDYRYWILGDGPDKQKVIEYCRETGISDKITCFGNIKSEELFKYYSAADIYAHASTMEGQALCEMEAYATGIRIIVNQDIKDTIATDIDNKEIYYKLDFDNIDTEDLMEWIKDEIPNRQSRNDMSWAVIADKYEMLYKKIYNKILK